MISHKCREYCESPQAPRDSQPWHSRGTWCEVSVFVLGRSSEATRATSAPVTDAAYLYPASAQPALPNPTTHNFLSSPETPYSLFTPRVFQSPWEGLTYVIWLWLLDFVIHTYYTHMYARTHTHKYKEMISALFFHLKLTVSLVAALSTQTVQTIHCRHFGQNIKN